MSKAPGVLVPPVECVIADNQYVYNPRIVISSICMFGYVGSDCISFALLGGHCASWFFDTQVECCRAMQSIYDQLGVIE